MNKALLRKVALDQRRLLPISEYRKRNSILCENIHRLIRENNFKIIHTFLPITKNSEPDVTSLFKEWWNEGRKIMVSKTDIKTKTMSHFWFEKTTQVKTNSWGIPEPLDAEPANFQATDLVIVPLLIGDKQGNRIGYGGGYYDKLLHGFRGQTVGLSLSPLVDQLETDPWDIPLNTILFP